MSNTIRASAIALPLPLVDLPALRACIADQDSKGPYTWPDPPDLPHYLVYYFIGLQQLEIEGSHLIIALDRPRRSALTWRDVTQVVRGLLALFWKGAPDSIVPFQAYDLDWDNGAQRHSRTIPLLPFGQTEN